MEWLSQDSGLGPFDSRFCVPFRVLPLKRPQVHSGMPPKSKFFTQPIIVSPSSPGGMNAVGCVCSFCKYSFCKYIAA